MSPAPTRQNRVTLYCTTSTFLRDCTCRELRYRSFPFALSRSNFTAISAPISLSLFLFSLLIQPFRRSFVAASIGRAKRAPFMFIVDLRLVVRNDSYDERGQKATLQTAPRYVAALYAHIMAHCVSTCTLCVFLLYGDAPARRARSFCLL